MSRVLTITTLFVCLLAGTTQTAAQQSLSLSLREAVERAIAQNPDVQIANLSVLEAKAGLQQSRSQLLPQVGVQVLQRRQTSNLQGIGLIFPGFPARIGPFNAFDARPQLTQTVLDVGAWKSVAAARDRIRQADAGQEAIQQGTTLSVISFYLQAVELESRIRAGEQRLASARAVEKQVRAGYEAGTASKLDLSRAVLQTQSEIAALRTLEGSLASTKEALNRLLGIRESTALQLTDGIPGTEAEALALAGAEARATSDNPEIMALRHAVSAARNDAARAKLQRLPRISFFGDYGVNGVTPTNSLSTYQYGGLVEIPVFTSGRIRGEVAQQNARLRTAEEQLRSAELRILADLRSAHAEWERAREAALATSEALSAARENLDLTRARYEAGIADSVSVLQAQASLAEIENLDISTRVQREIAAARFQFAAGNVGAYLR